LVALREEEKHVLVDLRKGVSVGRSKEEGIVGGIVGKVSFLFCSEGTLLFSMEGTLLLSMEGTLFACTDTGGTGLTGKIRR